MSKKVWGDYEIHLDRSLGRGGRGEVYLGRQVSTDRPVAIKVLKASIGDQPGVLDNFARQAAFLTELGSPNIVEFVGTGSAEGRLFYAMEYVEGGCLSLAMRRGRRYSIREVLYVVAGVCLALEEAWAHRIVHREVKPSNILVAKDGTTKLSDFGLPNSPDQSMGGPGQVVGNARYISPEQARNLPYDVRGDLYSLGTVIYHLVCGKPPFDAPNAAALLYRQVHEAPTLPCKINPGVPRDLETVILKLLEKDPDRRYASPTHLSLDLERILAGASLAATQPGIVLPAGQTRPAPPQPGVVLPAVPPTNAPAPPTTKVTAPLVLVPTAPSTVVLNPPAPAPSRSSAWMTLAVALWLVVLGASGVLFFQSILPFIEGRPARAAISAPKKEKPRSASTTPPSPASAAPAPAPAVSPAQEDLRRRGMAFMRSGEWRLAYELLEQARGLGASDLDPAISLARYEEMKEKGDAEKDPARAKTHYLEAQRHRDGLEIQLRIAIADFLRAAATARALEGRDWAQAAEHWTRAGKIAPAESQVKQSAERHSFCATAARASQAQLAGDWKAALDHFRTLEKTPGDHAAWIRAGITESSARVAEIAAKDSKKLSSRLAALLMEGRRAYRNADWIKAKEAFDEANEARYAAASLPSDREEIRRAVHELAAAVVAPEGMVFVPSGFFRMGGGRPIEGPEGKAITSAFFIDAREVTVGEYGAFLAARDAGGHVPGCHPDEPGRTNHDPGSQAPKGAEESMAGVTWWDAHSYSAWRGKRLPSEAEWEKTAGYAPGGKRVYPWGAEYRKGGGPSFLGSHGMGGGVIEWTADWFERYPWSKVTHADFGRRKKVLRGGVILEEDAPQTTKVTYRFWNLPAFRSRRIGFRCAMNVAEPVPKKE